MMARPPSAASILRKERIAQTVGKGAVNMELPNHSGDHSKGIVRQTPVNDMDIVNKKYVDDAIAGEDLWDRTGTNTYLKNSGDNVGIGTTNPSVPLQLYTDDALRTGTFFMQQDGSGDCNFRFGLVGGVNWAFGIDNSDGDKLKIESSAQLGSATAEMTILTNGRVGINNTSPDCALDVGGAITSNCALLDADSDNYDVSGINTLFIDTSSNNVTLGGLTGGVEGQYLHVIKKGDSNILTVEHEEGVGDQDFELHDGSDETIGAGKWGGFKFVCCSGAWWDCQHK